MVNGVNSVARRREKRRAMRFTTTGNEIYNDGQRNLQGCPLFFPLDNAALIGRFAIAYSLALRSSRSRYTYRSSGVAQALCRVAYGIHLLMLVESKKHSDCCYQSISSGRYVCI